MTTRKTKQPVAVVCHDGKRCKGTHPLICRDHGCGILAGRAAAAESDSAPNERGTRSLERVGGRGSGAPDANVEAVREKLRQRAEVGLRKYGVTTERTDMGLVDWLRHAQEEALDQAVYLEAAIKAASSPTDPSSATEARK